MPTHGMMSPLSTPPTVRAQRAAESGLAVAEALESAGYHADADAARAEALQEAYLTYQAASYLSSEKGRRPLSPIDVNGGCAVLSEEAVGAPDSDGVAVVGSAPPASSTTPAVHLPAGTSTASSTHNTRRSSHFEGSLRSPRSAVGLSNASIPRTNSGLADAGLACLATGWSEVSLVSGGVHPSAWAAHELKAVLISGTSVVRHLEERPFALYLLHAPLSTGEHVAFRRYSDFVALDASIRWRLDGRRLRLPCMSTPTLPPLPPRALPWTNSTESKLVAARWGGLQIYLDAVLDRIGESEAAWKVFRDFLFLPSA